MSMQGNAGAESAATEIKTLVDKKIAEREQRSTATKEQLLEDLREIQKKAGDIITAAKDGRY